MCSAIINAGGREGDLKHVREQIKAKGFHATAIAATDPHDPHIKESYLGCAQHMLALQGPNSEKLLQPLVDHATDLSKLGYYRMTRGTYAQLGVPLPHPEAAVDTVLAHARRWDWFRDEERNAGVRTIAAPVLRGDGTAAAAIAVQGPVVRLDDDRLTELRAPLQRTASGVAELLTATLD